LRCGRRGFGYGRVSARDRNQRAGDQLDVAGCEWVFIGHARGKLASRPELDMALLVAGREGDTLALLKGR
jgi:DNA invertase Pin-like site-specific DNA recombinase